MPRGLGINCFDPHIANGCGDEAPIAREHRCIGACDAQAALAWHRWVLYIPAGEKLACREPLMSSTVITWIVIGVIVLLAIWMVTVYNGLVALRQRVNEAFSDIDVQTKQRHDLVPNLVETVKGYAAHERGTLEAVVRARNTAVAAPAGNVGAQAAAENALSGALRQLFALSEAYPDLKANQNFQQLQAELTDLENKIAAARRFFNNAVQEYNTGIAQFPAVLVAGTLGFTPKEFFDVGAEQRKELDQAPQVKF
jgi:LemA protein